MTSDGELINKNLVFSDTNPDDLLDYEGASDELVDWLSLLPTSYWNFVRDSTEIRFCTGVKKSRGKGGARGRRSFLEATKLLPVVDINKLKRAFPKANPSKLASLNIAITKLCSPSEQRLAHADGASCEPRGHAPPKLSSPASRLVRITGRKLWSEKVISDKTVTTHFQSILGWDSWSALENNVTCQLFPTGRTESRFQAAYRQYETEHAQDRTNLRSAKQMRTEHQLGSRLFTLIRETDMSGLAMMGVSTKNLYEKCLTLNDVRRIVAYCKENSPNFLTRVSASRDDMIRRFLKEAECCGYLLCSFLQGDTELGKWLVQHHREFLVRAIDNPSILDETHPLQEESLRPGAGVNPCPPSNNEDSHSPDQSNGREDSAYGSDGVVFPHGNNQSWRPIEPNTASASDPRWGSGGGASLAPQGLAEQPLAHVPGGFPDSSTEEAYTISTTGSEPIPNTMYPYDSYAVDWLQMWPDLFGHADFTLAQ